MVIDPQITNALAEVASLGILAIGGWLISLLERKLSLAKDGRAAQIFEAVATNAIALGAKRVGEQIAGGAVVHDKAGAIAQEALDYAAPKLVAEMARLKIDPDSLPERLEARVAASGVSVNAVGQVVQPAVMALAAQPIQ